MTLRTAEEWEAEGDLTIGHLAPIVEAHILELLKTGVQFTTTELANAIYYGEDKEIKRFIFDAIKHLKKTHRVDDCWVKGPQKGVYMGKPVFPPIWGPIQPGRRCPRCNRLKEGTYNA